MDVCTFLLPEVEPAEVGRAVSSVGPLHPCRSYWLEDQVWPICIRELKRTWRFLDLWDFSIFLIVGFGF